MCAAPMFKFGFKANFSLSSRKKNFKDTTERSIVGAYRANSDESYGYGRLPETKKVTPSSVILPPNNQYEPPLREAKSTSDVTVQHRVPPHLTKSNPNISTDPKGGTSKTRDSAEISEKPIQDKNARNNEKERKKLDKQRLVEQKRREKMAIQQQLKEDKIRKEKEKQQAQQEAKRKEKEKKNKPKTQPTSANPLARNANPVNEMSIPSRNNPNEGAPQYSDTIDSSISTSSGPPPYSEKPIENATPQSGLEEFPKQRRITSNIRFGKTMDESKSSWDMISQHREHISRPLAADVSNPRQLNLQYDVGSSFKTDVQDNSEA